MRLGLSGLLHEFDPTAGEGGEGEGGAGEAGDAGGGGEGGERSFSQTEVDRIVQDRLARDRKGRPSDDELTELRAKAARADELEAASKTELEKAQERATKAEAERAEAIAKAQKVLTDSHIVTAAAGKFADPSDALALIDRSALEFDDTGAPTNVAELVDGLLTAKPHLAPRRTGSLEQGARDGGGVTQITAAQLETMTPAEIQKAESEGRLTHLLSGRA